MDVEPFGLPPALKAWRVSEPEPVLTLRCGATADCGATVGAVYRSGQGYVVESRISLPEKSTPGPLSSGPMPDLDSFAGDLGVTGILDDFEVSTAGGDVEVTAAADGIAGAGESSGGPGEGGADAGEDSADAGEDSADAGEDSAAAGDADGEGEGQGPLQKVKAQIDLLSTSHYWHDPAPVCPVHGKLQLDRHQLDRAARRGETTFEALPR